MIGRPSSAKAFKKPVSLKCLVHCGSTSLSHAQQTLHIVKYVFSCIGFVIPELIFWPCRAYSIDNSLDVKRPVPSLGPSRCPSPQEEGSENVPL